MQLSLFTELVSFAFQSTPVGWSAAAPPMAAIVIVLAMRPAEIHDFSFDMMCFLLDADPA
jgi:hypothetical protein